MLAAGFYVTSRAHQVCEHHACDMPSGCVSLQVSRTNSLQGPSLVRPRAPASRNKNLMGFVKSQSGHDLLSPQSTARRPIFPAGEEVSPQTRWARPQSRWIPFHYRETLTTAKIRRADESSALDYAAHQLQPDDIGRVRDLLTRGDTDGLLVMHHGKVVYEYLVDGVPAWQTHSLNSASKVFTGCVAAILADQGKLSWDKPLHDYAPQLKGTGYEGVMMQAALDMQSGIVLDPMAEFKALGQHPDQGSEPAIGVAGLTLSVKQGSGEAAYAPACTDTDAVGMACEQVTGKSMPELISELIWVQIGAKEDADMTLDHFRTPIYNGGMCATLQDLGRFTNMLLNKGKVGNKQVVPAAYIEDSIVSTSCLREAMNGNFYNMPWPGAAFHNTFFLDPDRKATYNYGAFGNLLYVDHDASACCVLLSAWEKPNEQIQEWMSALQELVKSL